MKRQESALTWAISLGLRISDMDDAILFERFWRAWVRYYSIPLDDDDAGGLLEFARATRAAWRVVRQINRGQP